MIQRAGAWDERPARLTAAPVPPAAPPRTADVIGYVSVARDRDRGLDADAAAMGSSCERRGWHLTRLVYDRESPGAPLASRAGLAFVLDLIAGRRVAGLVLTHLGDLSRSPAELAVLLRRLEQAGAFLVALDHQLDTTTTAGKLAARVLMDIGGWQRARIAPRPAATGAPGTSRPHDPKLRARIDSMRARGMSLQAICDTLNAEGVPALRPGTHWRPSSVDVAAAPHRKPSRLEPVPLARPTPKEAVNPSA